MNNKDVKTKNKKRSKSGCFLKLIILTMVVIIILYFITKSEYLGISFGLGIVLLLFAIIANQKEKALRMFDSAPEITEHVKIISKSFEVAGSYARTYYYIAFELDSGERKSISVDNDTYNVILENEIGILTYKEAKGKTHFISFKLDDL